TRAAQRVPHVVLTVAKRSLSVLPGFAPIHGRKTKQKGVRRELSQQRSETFLRPLRAQFQCMLLRRVVIKTWQWQQARDVADEQVAFGWMEVATRRIGA